MTKAVYELQPIGVNKALEAVQVFWFCSEPCRQLFLARANGPHAVGIDDEWIDGTVCDECGHDLMRTQREQ